MQYNSIDANALEHSRSALTCIEDLMRDLADETGTPKALLREHLDSARFYLHGSMPVEYRFSLGLARDLVPDLPDKGLRDRVMDFLQSQEHNTA
jgi:hypothetical protein